MKPSNITVGVVDDHQLFLRSISLMLSSFENFTAILEATNGKDLQKKFETTTQLPDIMLIDVNMPLMDGPQTADWLSKNYPTIKMVALSMNESDKAVINMIKAGCCAYLLKDTHPDEFEKALNEIAEFGFYNADVSNVNYRRLLRLNQQEELHLSAKEKQFLQLACSDLTYKQIATQMNLSERTIDGYRENIFLKFNVQSRVGMALEAIRRELVTL